jgi:hypothetical protein
VVRGGEVVNRFSACPVDPAEQLQGTVVDGIECRTLGWVDDAAQTCSQVGVKGGDRVF